MDRTNLITALLILFFSYSYGQLTYKDIINIENQKSFERIMIENGFEFVDEIYDEEYEYTFNITYAKGLTKVPVIRDGIVETENEASIWANYYGQLYYF